MRFNWFKWGGLAFVTLMLVILAWWGDANLTMRRLSLGEPDPAGLIIPFLWIGVLSVWAFYQRERANSPVLITINKRVALHNTDPYAVIKPPKEWVEAMKAAAEKAGVKIKYPDLLFGEWVVYVGEGVRLLRLTGSGESVVAVFPKKLADIRGDMVECMGLDRVYNGLDHAWLPQWILTALQESVPGFSPLATEIIFADTPHHAAVLAWDLDRKEERWTRSYVGKTVDYQARMLHLEALVEAKRALYAHVANEVLENAAKLRRKGVKLPREPEAQPANNAQDVGGRDV